MSEQFSPVYEFGPFQLIPGERQLLRDGKRVPLQPKVFDTLVILVQNTGHALKKEDLINQVWPDSFVEESNLNHNISALRKALGDTNGDAYVETIRGYGFRFNGQVNAKSQESPPLLLHRRTRTQFVFKEEETEERKLTLIERPVEQRRFSRMATLVGLLVVAASVALLAGFLIYSPSTSVTSSPRAIRSVAILPFTSLTTGQEDAYLGLGMADALITKLGQVKQVGIRPTSAIQRYTDSGRDPVAVGRDLKVEAVLDGRIHRSGERVRITVQLLRVADSEILWTEEFGGKYSEIFYIQDLVSKGVVRAVAPNLTPVQIARLTKHGTENARAYESYLRGRYLWNKRTTDHVRESVEHFKQAIAEDPNFALAYDGLADAYLIYDALKAEPILRAALALDETLGEAHASLGFLRMFWHWDWKGAETEFKRAIELKPNYATARQWYALFLASQGRIDEAKKEMAIAIELDPRSPNLRADLAQIHYFAHEYDEAIAECRKALEFDPQFSFAHGYLVAIYARKGLYAEAVEAQLTSNFSYSTEKAAELRNAFVKSGWPGFLRRSLEFENLRTPSTRKAWLYISMGEESQAIKELEQAYDARDFFLTFLKVEPSYDNLRSDPRFQEVLRRMNLS